MCFVLLFFFRAACKTRLWQTNGWLHAAFASILPVLLWLLLLLLQLPADTPLFIFRRMVTAFVESIHLHPACLVEVTKISELRSPVQDGCLSCYVAPDGSRIPDVHAAGRCCCGGRRRTEEPVNGVPGAQANT